MRPLRVAVAGGGPAGLFLARLLRLSDPRARVVVHERNPADATFGFGVVFSDRTLSSIRRADRPTYERIMDGSQRWTDMEIRYRGTAQRISGFGFTAIERHLLLRILQEQAAEAGAELHFECEARPELADEADVLVAADGVNSTVRRRLASELGASELLGTAKYAWFGTTARFDAVTFPFVESEHGTFAAHAYPYDPGRSTFIVEVDEDTWRRAGMEAPAAAAEAPGASDLFAKERLEEVFGDHLGGHGLLVNNSKWANFRVVHNARWHHGNVVLIGDAAHTAHFSVGSGTKLAMEDAISLGAALAAHGDAGDAFRAYEEQRRPEVARTQRWALPSQRWWESFGRRCDMSPAQFAFHFLTRTDAMTYAGLLRRDPAAVEAAERSFSPQMSVGAAGEPIGFGDRVARNRIVSVPEVSPVTAARAGAGIVLVGDREVALGDIVLEAQGAGALAAVRVPLGDGDALERACGAGADLLELVPRGAADGPDAVVDAVARDVADARPTPALLAWPVPLVDAWGPEAEAIVRAAHELARLGLTGVRLIPDRAAGEDVELRPLAALPGLTLADRVRTETGLVVGLTTTTAWAFERPRDGEPWLTQAHVALVAGRVDLLATWPFHAPGAHAGWAFPGTARTGVLQ